MAIIYFIRKWATKWLRIILPTQMKKKWRFLLLKSKMGISVSRMGKSKRQWNIMKRHYWASNHSLNSRLSPRKQKLMNIWCKFNCHPTTIWLCATLKKSNMSKRYSTQAIPFKLTQTMQKHYTIGDSPIYMLETSIRHQKIYQRHTLLAQEMRRSKKPTSYWGWSAWNI